MQAEASDKKDIMMIDLGKLRLFYIVAQEGSVSKAAQRLNTSQPALSEHIMNFEHRLKVKLFKRVPTGMQLTAQGERLFEHAKKILEENEAFERIFYEQEGDLGGDLKIITYPFIGAHWLIPSLQGFIDMYPRLNLQIHLQNDHINPLEADVVIAAFAPPYPDLLHKPLFSDRNQLFASEAYLQKYGIPQTIEDLRHHRLIGYRRNYYSADRAMNLITHGGLSIHEQPRKPWMEVDLLQGLVSAVMAGYGIAELPNHTFFLNAGLKIILPELCGKELQLQYYYFENHKDSRKINALYEHLRQQKDFW